MLQPAVPMAPRDEIALDDLRTTLEGILEDLAVELAATENVVEACRVVKDEYEIKVLREAARRLSNVAADVLNPFHH